MPELVFLQLEPAHPVPERVFGLCNTSAGERSVRPTIPTSGLLAPTLAALPARARATDRRGRRQLFLPPRGEGPAAAGSPAYKDLARTAGGKMLPALGACRPPEPRPDHRPLAAQTSIERRERSATHA